MTMFSHEHKDEDVNKVPDLSPSTSVLVLVADLKLSNRELRQRRQRQGDRERQRKLPIIKLELIRHVKCAQTVKGIKLERTEVIQRQITEKLSSTPPILHKKLKSNHFTSHNNIFVPINPHSVSRNCEHIFAANSSWQSK